jgi:hypothetical protein
MVNLSGWKELSFLYDESVQVFRTPTLEFRTRRSVSVSLSLLRNVPEGRFDRSHSTRYRLLMASLARSAWDSATPKEPSRRVRFD